MFYSSEKERGIFLHLQKARYMMLLLWTNHVEAEPESIISYMKDKIKERSDNTKVTLILNLNTLLYLLLKRSPS